VPTYRVPVIIQGFAIIRSPDGKGAGDYIGGLPRDAEAEVGATPPYLSSGRMVDYTRLQQEGRASLVLEEFRKHVLLIVNSSTDVIYEEQVA
jgi:hypothetical protein